MDIALEAPRAAARTLFSDACGGPHARLDSRISAIDFDDRGAYADTLSRLSAPVSALENALTAGVAPVLFDNWTRHRRASALRRDLDLLGGRFIEATTAPIEDEASALGTLYVLERSRLGARVLAQFASESVDEDVQRATHFFRHGEGVRLWDVFLDRLNASVAVRRNPERAERAAQAAFAAFDAAFG